MDRVLEAPEPKQPSSKEEFRLLFPGEKEWEIWSLRSGKASALKTSIPPPGFSGQVKNSCHLAIPLQHLLIIPLWLATTDSSLMREMVSLQLESRGLGKSSTESTFDYVVVRREDERSLLSVSVLNENFPAELCLPRIASYRPAPDYWTLPPNHLLIWRELSGIVLGFTSGTDLIYVQGSPVETVQDSFVYEAHCAHLLLESEGSLTGLQGITVFGSFSKEELQILQILQLPLVQADRPAPSRPKKNRKLLPSMVQHAQATRTRSKNQRNLLWMAAVFYLLILGTIFGQLAWLGWQKSQLEKQLLSHRQEAESIQMTSGRWQSLEQAVLPENYPIEILYRCTQSLPEEGIRFITYDQTSGHVLIAGEAKNALTALQYAETLKKNPELDVYEWEMPPPALLPNESAQFRIEGKRRDANP